MTAGKPKIVLVHGVWLDGSSWAEVIRDLVHRGYEVHAAQLPLTSFEADVAAVNRTINHAGAPIILVGHSYGGAVISAAGNSELVEKLVYIAAVVPQPGQPFGAVMAENPPAAHVQMKPVAEGFIWADTSDFHDAMAHDIHRSLVELAVAVQKPFAGKLFAASLPNPAWQSKPSWYLIATEDRILNPITQRAIVQRINAKAHGVASSHLPQVAKPHSVVEIIVHAASS